MQFMDIREDGSTELLGINGKSPENYFRTFQWDFAKYQHQGRQLADLVQQIQGISAKIDDELKKLATMYNEKNSNLAALQRKKTINFVTSDLEDFLKPEKFAGLQILNSASLLTVFVVVNKSSQRG
jgi:glutathionylspermidine synthase